MKQTIKIKILMNHNFLMVRIMISEGIKKIGSVWIYIFVTLMSLLFSITTNAQASLTLSQAINNGLANKKNIVAGKLNLTMSKLQTETLYRNYWPQVSAGYSYLYNPILQTSILPIGVFNPNYPADATKSVKFGTKWTQSAGLTANQPLLDLSIQTLINEAKLQERIASLSQEQSEYELVYTIAQTYIEIYLQEAKIRWMVVDTNRTYLSYKLLLNEFVEKRLLKSDLNKSKINHNNNVQLLSDGIAELIEDKVYLIYLMGVSDIEKWDFEMDSTFLSENSLASTFNPAILNQLPDIQQLTLQSELTNLQAMSEKTKHMPIVGFKGYLGANQFANTFNPAAANTWFGLSYLGLDVKVPLLFGTNTHNKIQQLNLESKQYNLQKEDKTLQYTKDVFTANLKIQNIKTQLKAQEENITLSTESIEIYQARVKEGQESISNLNLEEASLQLLKTDYERNKKQLWVYWLNYLKDSGQLSTLWK